MKVILDTGPWVALIDRSENMHLESLTWFKDFEGEIFSTEAVLTEVLYLLNFSSSAQSAVFDFVLNGAVTLVPSSLDSLATASKLMEKYNDLPMDFADATLVCLAQDLAINHIATFDKKHFNIYRSQGRQTFILLP